METVRTIRVVAAVIEREGRYLITQRRPAAVLPLISFVSHPYERYVVDLYLYECRITGGDISPLAVNAFKWVTSAEFDQYPFTPADEASMNKLLGVG